MVDGYAIAKEAGLGTRINTVLQTCFFALADIFPIDEAVQAIKDAIVASYGKRGETVLTRNFAAVDAAVAGLHEVRRSPTRRPATGTSCRRCPRAPPSSCSA